MDDEPDDFTAVSEGRPLRRIVCRAVGHHDWTSWYRNASGWPTRRCLFCGRVEVRLDPSW